jgi:exopolysaccharide production protein ExoZ
MVLDMGPDRKSESLLAIQILRAVAALSVCAVHFNWLALALAGHQDAPLPTYPLAAGVDLFFVISGFVMVYSSEPLFGSTHAPAIFLWRRLVRIVPLYWLTTAISIPVMSTAFDLSSLLKSLFFIPYKNPSGALDPLYGVGWTLNFEMFFYVVFASAVGLSRNMATLAAAATISICVFIGIFVDGLPVPLRFWADPIAMEFVLGMGLAIAYRSGLRLPRWAGLALCLIGGLAIWRGIPNQPPSGDRLLFCGLPAAMIFAGLTFQPPLPKAFKWGAPLGDASYSIYLIHGLLAAAVLRCWQSGLNIFGIGRITVVLAITTILFSLVSFRWIEAPLNHLLRSFGRSAYASSAQSARSTRRAL